MPEVNVIATYHQTQNSFGHAHPEVSEIDQESVKDSICAEWG